MGSICSCLCLDGLEEFIHADNSARRHCSCLRCLAQQLLHVNTLLQRGEVCAIPSVEQRTPSLDSSTATMEDSIPDTHRSPLTPLPYDDPRCSRMQREGLISRHDKSSGHFQEESEPLRTSNSAADMEMSTTKCCGPIYEFESKLNCSKSSLKSTSEVPAEVLCTFSSYEDKDEDVCPTCLEEYTYENPRIIMNCSHHFHLGCIYEWQERSELCPVCGKVMVFDET